MEYSITCGIRNAEQEGLNEYFCYNEYCCF